MVRPHLERFNTDGTAEVIIKLPFDNNKYIASFGKDVYVTSGWNVVIYKVYVGKEGYPPYAWGP